MPRVPHHPERTVSLNPRAFQHLDALIRLVFGRRAAPSSCQSCGYSITGLPGPNCPECGVSIHFPGLGVRDPDRLAATVLLCLMLLTFGRSLARAVHWFVIVSSPDHRPDALDFVPFLFIGLFMLVHATLFSLMRDVVRRERSKRGWNAVGKAIVLTLAAACPFLMYDPLGFP